MNYFVCKTSKLLSLETGWGNGYISLPPSHPLYEKHYNNINDNDEYFIPHGLWTYSNYFSSFNKNHISLIYFNDIEINDKDWILGFDTSHLGDNPKNWNKNKVIKETLITFDFYSKIENFI
jgi:hypothetical protein